MKSVFRLTLFLACVIMISGCGKSDQDSGKKMTTAQMVDAATSSPQKTLGQLQQKAAENPQDPSAFKQLGELYLMQNEIEKAEGSFVKAVQLDSNDPETFNQLGLVYIKKGDIANALRSLTTAISLDPNNVQANFNMGNLAFSQKQFEVATNFYRKTLSIDPDHRGAQAQLSVILDAVAQAQSKKS